MEGSVQEKDFILKRKGLHLKLILNDLKLPRLIIDAQPFLTFSSVAKKTIVERLFCRCREVAGRYRKV